MIEATTTLNLNLDLVLRRISAGVRKAFVAGGAKHVETMTKRFKPFGGFGFGGAGAAGIQTRTGSLKRSFGFELRGSGLELEMRLFSAGLPYIRKQEYGGTIQPKTPKRYLTIPLPDAQTPGGALKGGAKLVPRGNKYETADGAPTFVFKSKAGNLLVGTRSRNGSLKLLYTLKPSVTLKPRLGFGSTFATVTAPFLEQRLNLEASKL